MAEDQIPPVNDNAPATSPAMSSEEIQAMIAAEATKLVDARIPKLQATYERQLAEARKEIERLRDNPDADLSAETSYERELTEAKRQVEALQAARQYPEVFPLYESMMNARTAEEQLSVLQEAVLAQPSDQPPARPEQPQAPVEQRTPPVDPNQSAPTAQEPKDGQGMNKEVAQRIIDSVGDIWPRFE